MRSIPVAILAAAATVGILLTVALASLNTWEWHVVGVTSPRTGSDTSVATVAIDSSIAWGSVALTSLLQGLVWASLVVVPGASAAKRFTFGASTQLVVAVLVVVLSSVAFCGFRTIHNTAPLAVFLAIGGLIGLAGIGTALWVLPPNKSLERTREG